MKPITAEELESSEKDNDDWDMPDDPDGGVKITAEEWESMRKNVDELTKLWTPRGYGSTDKARLERLFNQRKLRHLKLGFNETLHTEGTLNGTIWDPRG